MKNYIKERIRRATRALRRQNREAAKAAIIDMYNERVIDAEERELFDEYVRELYDSREGCFVPMSPVGLYD